MYGNKTVVGAFLIGFALIGGSYVLTHFGSNRAIPSKPVGSNAIASVVVSTPNRKYIAVTDSNHNGIEDWREEFVPKASLVLDPTGSTTEPYQVPKTLTDQISIQLFQSIMRAQASGKVGPSQTDIINNTAKQLERSVKDVIYNASYITVVATSSPEAIRTYANTMAQIVIDNNVPNWKSEIDILNDAVTNNNPDALKKLIPLMDMYKNMRDQTIATPVPQKFMKQHLDLINVYQAMYASIRDMQLVFTDPVVSLLRIKRYHDDTTGLTAALQNMYNAMLPYAAAFQPNDPAILFVQFDPRYQ